MRRVQSDVKRDGASEEEAGVKASASDAAGKKEEKLPVVNQKELLTVELLRARDWLHAEVLLNRLKELMPA